MKGNHTSFLLLAAICHLFGVQAHSENLNEILNQISSDLETRKASGLTNSPPNKTTRTNSTDTSAGIPRVDETGLQPGSSLGIVDAKLRDGTTGKKVLRVAIKARPGITVDTHQMKLHVFFYEQDETGEIQLTESKVVSQWISPPVNWADNEPELLDVTYVLPDSTLPGSAASNGSPGRVFVGYIVGIYYNSELQDTRADPGNLANKFALPLYLKQEAQ